MPELNDKSIEQLVELGRAAGFPRSPAGGNLQYAVIPQNCKVEDLSRFVYNEHSERPERKKGAVKVLDAASFNEYFTLFRDENSRVFADETTGRIVGVLDYHEAGAGGARWGQHRVELTLRESEEWQAWTGKDGEKLAQADFAEFIETNAPDITDPSAATMLEVARDLMAKTEAEFGSAMRMQNGSVSFKYTEQTTGKFGKDQLEVPENFTVSIPVYVGTPRISLIARLRYRIHTGRLTFWFDLLRANAAERAAFQAIYETIADALQVKIINGIPA